MRHLIRLLLPLLLLQLLNLMVSVDCCTDLYATDSTATFNSHTLYGISDYSSFTSSCWIIRRLSSSRRVKIWTNSPLDLESNCHDYVKVYCGTSSSGERIDTFCDGEELDDLVSDSSAMYIEFQSDYSINAGGFQISYKQVSGNTNSDCKTAARAALAAGIIAAIVICCIIAVVVVVVIIAVCITRQNRARQGMVHPNTTGGITVVSAGGVTQPPPMGARPIAAPAYPVGGAPPPRQPGIPMQPMPPAGVPPPPAYGAPPPAGPAQYPPPPQQGAAAPRDPAYPPSGPAPPGNLY